MKKLVTAALILLLAACAVFAWVYFTGERPEAGDMTAAPAGTADAATSAPTAAPGATGAPAASPTAPPAAQTPAQPASVLASDYMPAANHRLTLGVDYGTGTPATLSYVFASVPDPADDGYTVTRFSEEQPMYYTDFAYIAGKGMYTRDSQGDVTAWLLLLPEVLSEGLEFQFGGQAATVVSAGGAVDLDGYSADCCIVIKSYSSSYLADVYHVFEVGKGETCSYILYDDDVRDVLREVISYEIIGQDEADDIIADSRM